MSLCIAVYIQSAAVACLYCIDEADARANRHVVQTRGYFVKLSGSDSATSVRSKTVSLWPRKQSGERQSSRKNSVQKFGLPESKSLARGRHVASLLTAQVEVSRQPGVRTWSPSTSAGVKTFISQKLFDLRQP
jgi:hypothetical protein